MDPALALLIGGILLWLSALTYMIINGKGSVDKQVDEKIKKKLDQKDKNILKSGHFYEM